MFLTLPLALLNALEDYWGEAAMNLFEFWGECMEALANADLRDL